MQATAKVLFSQVKRIGCCQVTNNYVLPLTTATLGDGNFLAKFFIVSACDRKLPSPRSIRMRSQYRRHVFYIGIFNPSMNGITLFRIPTLQKRFETFNVNRDSAVQRDTFAHRGQFSRRRYHHNLVPLATQQDGRIYRRKLCTKYQHSRFGRYLTQHVGFRIWTFDECWLITKFQQEIRYTGRTVPRAENNVGDFQRVRHR